MARIDAISATVVHATQRTDWVFLEVAAGACTGVGEATLDGCEPHLLAEMHRIAPSLIGAEVERGASVLVPDPDHRGGLAAAAVRSAIDQALWDLDGQMAGLSVASMLGGVAAPVDLYANVNRSLTQRETDAFASAALGAVSEGFAAVKVAPFDGVRSELVDTKSGRRLIDRGIERIEAVRDVVGPECRLMVDCHGRFDVAAASAMMQRIEDVCPWWIESPVADRRLDRWRELRERTDLKLAGGEFIVGHYESERFLAASGVDVFMSDVKYCGGITGLVSMARLADEYGAALSPHCPSGPVGLAASAQVAAATANMPIVEYGWGEVDWRSQLTTPEEPVVDGRYEIGSVPGLGLALDDETVRRYRVDVGVSGVESPGGD